jgi:hypothetical protein
MRCIPGIETWLGGPEVLEDVCDGATEDDEIAEPWKSAVWSTPGKIFKPCPRGSENARGIG